MPSSDCASPHDSSSWARGTCQVHFSLVSSTKSEAWTLNGTFASLSAKPRSAGRVVDRVAAEDDERRRPARPPIASVERLEVGRRRRARRDRRPGRR